jgi:hypothetical protein
MVSIYFAVSRGVHRYRSSSNTPSGSARRVVNPGLSARACAAQIPVSRQADGVTGLKT